MFFFLSKTLSYFMMPFTLVVTLLLLSVFWKNAVWKKRFLYSALILLLFFSNDFIANEAMSAWEVETVPYASMKPHKLAIVLTGSTMPFMKPNDRIYFYKGADRVTHTVQLYKLGLIEKILISGGNGRLGKQDVPEADQFRAAMLMMGVDSSAIIIENGTRNTAESARQVVGILDSLQIPSRDCLLVTSAFHMRRSLACYQKVGLDIQPFSTDFYAHPREVQIGSLLLPNVDSFGVWNKLIKEWVGMVAYKVAGYI
jgi:uncharacterized SAM-binding protein YcdF (DUF218 family)